MKKLCNTAAFLLCFGLIMALCCLPAYAGQAVSSTVNIGGAQAQVAYITLSPSSVVTPLIPAAGACTDDVASSIISAAPGKVIAAVNGSFFNSYYNASQAKDINTGNYPAVYGALVVEGRMICSGGSAALGFDYDGSVRMGRVDLAATLTVNGITYVCWGVNTVYKQTSAVYALTEELPYAVDIPADSTIVVIRDERVISIEQGRKGYRTPSGAVAVVFDGNYKFWYPIEVGQPAAYGYTVRSGDKAVWSGMRNIIGASGMLVENGVNVVDQIRMNDSKQQPDAVGMHSFAALTKDGRLMLGTVNSSFRRIADSLVAMGVKDAIFLDGGASSMLYANGSFLVSPSRRLASVVAVVDDVPSDWASTYVDDAVRLGILSQELNCKYQTAITREDFCALIAGYIEAKTGKPLSQFRAEQGRAGQVTSFSDTAQAATLDIAALGVVNGYPDGSFRPNDSIKRQDAAAMLGRLARVMGANEPGPAKIFTDAGQISDYARSGVDFVSGMGIMNGNANGSFSPKANITREQAVITMMNTWRSI